MENQGIEMLQRLVLASGMLAITVFAGVLPAAADEVSYEKMGPLGSHGDYSLRHVQLLFRRCR